MAKTYTYEEMQKNLEFEEGATVKVTPEQLDELINTHGWELVKDTENTYTKQVNEFFSKRYEFVLPKAKAEKKEVVEEETDTEIPEETEMVNL